MSPAEASSHVQHDGARRSSVSFAAHLSPDRGAAAAARRLVRARLGPRIGCSMLDDVLLVMSELVTNAVRHGRGDVELAVAFDGARVRGYVADEGRCFARPTAGPSAGAVGGYGLHLVEQLAEGWGVQGRSAHVWFEIAERQPAAPAPA